MKSWKNKNNANRVLLIDTSNNKITIGIIKKLNLPTLKIIMLIIWIIEKINALN